MVVGGGVGGGGMVGCALGKKGVANFLSHLSYKKNPKYTGKILC